MANEDRPEGRMDKEEVITVSKEVRSMRDPLERVDALLNVVSPKTTDPELMTILLNSIKRVSEELKDRRAQDNPPPGRKA